jgi:small subunit ribosomal protein S20
VANIKQQKKRNRRSLEQRDRNLRYRSTIKTLFRRLDDASQSGDPDQVSARASWSTSSTAPPPRA